MEFFGQGCAPDSGSRVDEVHSVGAVVGDVNEGNLLVSQNGTVSLIDCDSYQISANGSDLDLRCWRAYLDRARIAR